MSVPCGVSVQMFVVSFLLFPGGVPPHRQDYFFLRQRGSRDTIYPRDKSYHTASGHSLSLKGLHAGENLF